MVLAIAALFSLAWLAFNFKYFASTQNGLIRLILGTAFSILIIVRPKPEDHADGVADSGSWTAGLSSVVRSQLLATPSAWSVVGGVLAALIGIVFEIHQVEWLGILLMLASCLSWVMPPAYSRDIFLSTCLFYWLHPLPGKIFGAMQIAMQKISVTGSEWFLHIINIRVWADGLILRTSLNVYEIPSWCSGMRTATTVFILSLGLGILKRLKWYQCAFIAVIAVAQALLLNILRISAMVLAGPFASKEADIQFLHDATGIIIIAAILLVWVEIELLQKAKQRMTNDATIPNWRFLRKVSEHPPFWRHIFSNKRALAFLLMLTVFSSIAIYKRRPYHRAEMIKYVCEMMLSNNDSENAERSAMVIRELVPGDSEWLMQIARIYIIRGKYDETLKLLPLIPVNDPERSMDKKIMMAYAHIGLANIEAADEIIKDIPERTKLENPLVAMIMAEIGVFSNNPEDAARFITRAKTWKPNAKRIHRLYPYLRAHRKWDAIRDSDSDEMTYNNVTETLCAVDAYIHKNDSGTIATISLDAIKRWPEDPRFLTPLFFMTLKRENPEWEERFAKHLHRCVKAIDDPEQLYPLFANCFRIVRPDLAWAIYRKIEKIDPYHPTLMLSAIRYGRSWFVFRKQFLSINAESYNDTINIAPMLTLGNILPFWQSTLEQIPLARELSSTDIDKVRRKYVKQLASEFEIRSKRNTMSRNMLHEYIYTLELAGQTEKITGVIQRYAKDISRTERMSILSEIYENKGNWQKVYETLHTLLDPPVRRSSQSEGGTSTKAHSSLITHHSSFSPPPPLDLLIRFCQSQKELRLGLAAIETAKKTAQVYPESTSALLNLASTLQIFASKEAALLALDRETPFKSRDIDLMKAHLLFDTERFSASERLCRSILIPAAPSSLKTQQSIVLPPAELALYYHNLATPSPAAFAATAKQQKENLKSTTSPFLHKLLTSWLEAYGLRTTDHASLPTTNREGWQGLQDKSAIPSSGGVPSGGVGSPSILNHFSSIGRSSTEKAVALHQLAMILCHKKDFKGAKLAISKAVKHLPESEILWRMLISLSRISSPPAEENQGEGVKSKNTVDPSVIAEARRNCPNSSEIWLAEIVARTKNQKSEVRSQDDKNPSTATLTSEQLPYSAATLTRAAEFLFRKDKHKEASLTARHATEKAQSLLPAYIIGVRCALYDKNDEWALKCVQGCIDSALTPLPAFYETVVQLKSDGYNIDTDPEMINALKNLHEQDPDNRHWSEMLGYVQFMRGSDGLIDSMFHLTSAMNAGSTNKFVFALAGETARQLGNNDNAVAILRTAYKHYPEDKIIINNLIYTLAQSEATAPDALIYIPKLLRIDKQDPDILDTVATALLKAHQLDKAEDIITLLLKRHSHIQKHWFSANMKLAEIAMLRNNHAKAKTLLTEILNNISKISDEDVKAANKLLEKVGAAGRRD